jgi:four helix bundle protein
MHNGQNTNGYRQLEDRTLEFTERVIRLCKETKRDTVNMEIVKQLVRSSGSIGANYREANEALGKKDFTHRLRISRKEAKETSYWLAILQEAAPEHREEIIALEDETRQLRNILSAIIKKSL